VTDTPRSTGFSLRRWSQRKLAAARGEHDARPDVADAPVKAGAVDAGSAVATTGSPVASMPTATPEVAKSNGASTIGTTNAAIPLPPLESLTIDSDFSPFMQPGVDETVKRAALRKLLRDPRFNVMDGLDVYIDDYSKPSPIEPDLVRTLVQARYIFDPPKTRVTDEGIVEDVPDEPIAVASDVAAAEGGAAPALPDAATDANPVAAPALAEESATIPAPVEPSKSP